MKVRNLESPRSGRPVANQYIITNGNVETFQSYDSVIVKRQHCSDGQIVFLDSTYWDYSRTTAKYRNQFLGETTQETQKKINSGEYKLTDLNQ